MNHDYTDPDQTGRCQHDLGTPGISPGLVQARCELPHEAHHRTLYPETFEDNTGFARAVAEQAVADPDQEYIGGGNGSIEIQYGIEPARGADARCHTDELVSAIEDLPDYRDGARIITRQVSYGPWRYVIPEEFGD